MLWEHEQAGETVADIAAVRSSGARMAVFTGTEAVDTFHQLETLLCQWRRVEKLLSQDGPLIYSLTRTKLRPVPL